MSEKRVFIGSFIDAINLKKNFEEIIYDFDKVSKVKWTRTPDNFHITFFFLGNTKDSDVKMLNFFIQDIYNYKIEAEFEIRGINYFNKKGVPVVLYANINVLSNKLMIIHKEIVDFLFSSNIIEKKINIFKPHITLGRIKNISNDFYKVVDKYSMHKFDSVCKIKIEIIESILSLKGALYKPVKI